MEELGRISLTDNPASKQDAGIVCRVCQKQWSKYACPRCNVRYCSLPCYKAHSERCTEGFYRENAEDQLRQTKADPEDRRKMLQTLKRMQEAEQEEALESEGSEEDEVSDMEEDGGLEISEETLLRLREKGNDLSLEDLLPSERAALQRAAASGVLSRFIPAWEPWYLSPEAKRIRISPTGTRPVREVSVRKERTGDPSKTPAEEAFEKLVGRSICKADEEGFEENGHRSSTHGKREELSEVFNNPHDVEGSHDVTDADVMIADVTEEPAIPPSPEEDLPPLSSLTKSPPSPLMGCHVTSVLYAYCYVMRLFNGDWTADPADAAETLGVVTPVLSEGATPASVEDALYGCLERACSPSLAGPSGSSFARGLLEDVNGLLSLGRPGVVCALADVQRMFVAAGKESEFSFKKERGKSKRQLGGMSLDANVAESFKGSAQSSMLSRHEKQVHSAQARLAADKAVLSLESESRKIKPGSKRSRLKEHGRNNNPELVRRKVFFFLVWANEQPDETFQMLAAAVAEYAGHEKKRYESQGQFDTSNEARFLKPGAIEEVA